MKYLIWFTYYFTFGEGHQITTYLCIQKDSIQFYVYDVGYMKWKIDTAIKQIYNRRTATHDHYSIYNNGNTSDYFVGIYGASYKDMKAIIHATSSRADIVIFVPDTIIQSDRHQRINLLKFNNGKRHKRKQKLDNAK